MNTEGVAAGVKGGTWRFLFKMVLKGHLGGLVGMEPASKFLSPSLSIFKYKQINKMVLNISIGISGLKKVQNKTKI